MDIPRLHTPNLLDVAQLSKGEVFDLMDLATELKAGGHTSLLHGMQIALIFEKASTRTRCAFEVAAHHQGAHVTYLGPEGSHIGKEESPADTARVLGRMYDGIEFRGFDQSTVEIFAAHAGVPVWNGLTDQWHPTQVLADLMTMREHSSRPLEEVVLTYCGDGRNNVARSLLVGGAIVGMDVRIAAPIDLQPDGPTVELARGLAQSSGARISIGEDAHALVAGANFLYTDVWVSMGESAEQWDKRVPLLRPYRVDADLMGATGQPDTGFLHCLPSIHDRGSALGERIWDVYGLEGAEVSNDVFESASSYVFDQAENRLHTIEAVMVASLHR
jgi:ornithine carbamoyltransferase